MCMYEIYIKLAFPDYRDFSEIPECYSDSICFPYLLSLDRD